MLVTMAPATSVRPTLLVYYIVSVAVPKFTANASAANLSRFVRSGVIPFEELPPHVVDGGAEDHTAKPDAPMPRERPADERWSAKSWALSENLQPQSPSSEGYTSERLRSSVPERASSRLHSSRPYVYDQAAKPLSPSAGGFAYPLHYTSYHLFAPSLVENTRPGLEYFGDPPDSYDPLYYGKYQRLAEDVFENKFVQLRNAGDTRGDLYAETHRQKRRRKNRAH